MIKLTEQQRLLENFLRPTEDEVVAKFLKLPGAIRNKEPGFKWVYIPGKRPDRVLCVAHADTVHEDKPINDLLWIGDVCCRIGGQSGGGWGKGAVASGPLGADDRAGCALMYDLWDGSHSLLVTTGEERGLVGARAAVQDIKKELEKHQFAVQVDRRGDRQAVFYDVGTDKFKAFITSTLSKFDFENKPWREFEGSSTDIRHICGEILLCGVNLSAGFWHEHSDGEMLLLGAWMHTRTVLKKLLKLDKLEQFKFRARTYAPVTQYGGVSYYHVGSMFVSDVEELIKEVDKIDLATISGKKRKKLAAKVRKFVEKAKIQRWQAVRMLDKIYPPELAADKEHQLLLLPAATPMADSYQNRDDVLCYCGAAELAPVEEHKLWCHKRPSRAATGKVRVCLHGKPIAASCTECEKAAVAHSPCPSCRNTYVHKAECPNDGAFSVGVPGGKGNVRSLPTPQRTCETCAELLPNHKPQCIWNKPDLCGYCHRKIADGHSIICPDWGGERGTRAEGDGFCSECYYNLTVNNGQHADTCSFATHSRVRVKPKALTGTVHQEIPALEVTVCVHHCSQCSNNIVAARQNGVWKHSRLPLNQAAPKYPRGCMLPYVSPCTTHSKESHELVQWYEIRVKEALDNQKVPEPSRHALPPAAIPDPHDVTAQLREAGSWE